MQNCIYTIMKIRPKFPSTEGHSTRSGSNACVLQRIIEPWNENTVNWNNQPEVSSQNEVLVPESITATQDYEIDVTQLVRDTYNHLSSSFGFMFHLVNEDFYRAMIFASSDHVQNDLHPKLVITYLE